MILHSVSTPLLYLKRRSGGGGGGGGGPIESPPPPSLARREKQKSPRVRVISVRGETEADKYVLWGFLFSRQGSSHFWAAVSLRTTRSWELVVEKNRYIRTWCVERKPLRKRGLGHVVSSERERETGYWCGGDEKLQQQRRLSISGDEETLRVRLFRARCKALPNSNQLDVPWGTRKTDEEPEQDEKSLNETILQTKNHEMEIDQAQAVVHTTGADGGCVHPADDRGTHGDDKTTRVGIAVAQEIAKLSREKLVPDAGGASAGLGLRSSPSRDSGLTPKIRKPPRKMPRKMVTVEDRDMEEVQETSTPWDPKTPLGLLPGRLGVNEEPSDESESDSEREPVNWRGRQTQRSWPKTEPAMVTPTDHVRAEQRWKWARMLRDTGLTFSGAKDKLGAETFLARLERYRTKGAIPQEDMLFAVDALLVGEAQVWYESVEHKLHSWQDFERRFRRSFANQATPEELLTELRRRRTQGKGEDINTYLTNFDTCVVGFASRCHTKIR
ncbi:unnamed protein product [Trichogramma brassicae]|uniref:Retrotransposon gag domain-containing protein n=1 Tax=Trichogramma brassicae TaxID=86971 RepID=A0A6H5IU78_9HYME|nr:unnamed protein product [Trichogramma brassicae]